FSPGRARSAEAAIALRRMSRSSARERRFRIRAAVSGERIEMREVTYPHLTPGGHAGPPLRLSATSDVTWLRTKESVHSRHGSEVCTRRRGRGPDDRPSGPEQCRPP